MKLLITVAALAATVSAAKEKSTFAVMHFQGKKPLMQARVDPIVDPNAISKHMHTVQGANAFHKGVTGKELLEKSTCSTAKIKGDNSAYWMPTLYFHDEKAGTYEPVPLFYMNVYYFFQESNDDIKAFPVGLQMVSGDASKRTPPTTGDNILDTTKGTIQPAQFTCPRSNKNLAGYPANSDGSMAGIADKNNKGAGAGFPFTECDGYASPLRADLHFPSCYDTSKGLTDWKNNMKWPANNKGKLDCPPGHLHVPHLFYEMYWNTPLFKDRWTPNSGSQPFVLSNGDATGFSLHGDFLSAWEPEVLQHFIDTCDAGNTGFEKCPSLPKGLWPDTGSCFLDDPFAEYSTKSASALPGSNNIFGWKYGTTPAPAQAQDPAPVPAPAQSPPVQVLAPVLPSPSPEAPKPTPSPEAPKAEAVKPETPKPAEPTPPVVVAEQPAPAPPAVTVAPTVINTVDAAGSPTRITTWAVVTQWVTVTVYDDDLPAVAAPTPAASKPEDAKAKRHVHNHFLRHRGHRGSHLRR